MEIELKYIVDSKETCEAIFEDSYLFSIEEDGTREKVFMKAAYFDTNDHILSANDIAFRVRLERDKLVASLKWRGKCEGALHKREEINVPVDNPDCFLMPDPGIFKESEIGKEVIRLVDGKPLISIMEIVFMRSRFKVDTGSSIVEVSLDVGEIMTEAGNQQFCELELELFSGSEEELVILGDRLSAQYNLLESPESKYVRGLRILGIR